MKMTEGHSYAEAGVDIDASKRAIASLGEWLDKTLAFRSGEVFSDVKGHYSGLYRLGGGRILSMSTDSVGTKLVVAEMVGRYDTVGIDLLGVLANDIISVGSTPVAMVDYIGVEKPDPDMLAEVGRGIYEGCRQANVVVIGGETATVPDLIKGFDLAGAIIGLSGEEELVLGSEISDGDVVIGLESSGIHSNGYTLARRAFFDWNNYSVTDPLPTDPDVTIGEALLTPTVIYVEVVLDILSKLRPHGLAHISGGGARKMRRLKKGIGYVLDSNFPVQPVFEAIRRLAKVPWQEMFRTYNMGMGFAVIVDPSDRDEVIEICEGHGMGARAVGSAFKDPDETIIVKAREKIIL
ncbi:MAG: phosphoribosylformylglycinamidine cyclo-ligase [Theionarchaea archaeon]|nr:phosphoribosylformylglycinamidine cyclo-ligase [Theionarchaea archaeon]